MHPPPLTEGKFLGPLLTLHNCPNDICPGKNCSGNILSGTICQIFLEAIASLEVIFLLCDSVIFLQEQLLTNFVFLYHISVYIRHISGISQVYLKHISGLSKEYLRQISGISQANLRLILGISQANLRHISGLS